MSLLTNNRIRENLSNGKYSIVNRGFVEVLKFFELENASMSESMKTMTAIKLFFGDKRIIVDENGVEKSDYILSNIDGRDINKYFESISNHIGIYKNPYGDEDDKTNSKNVVCFEKDSSLIMSAFLQIYGINLMRDNIPWVEFIILFQGLPDSTKLSKVIEIRDMPIPKTTKDNIKEVQDIICLKNYYSISDNDIEEDMAKEFMKQRQQEEGDSSG